MNPFRFLNHAGAAVALLLVANSLASAQATRTWVSGVGDDANPCSRTAPCKTFAGAISKTAAGGEINCIDPGGYGAVTITKSITIDGNGTHASILAAGTNGVIINAASTDTVTLRNLSINGASTGLDAIRVLQARNVFVEKCTVFGFTGEGIDYAVGGPSIHHRLQVKDSVFQKCAGGGIKLTPVLADTSVVNAVLDNVRLEGNSFGFQANDRAKATLRNCSMSGNLGQGVVAFALGAGPVDVNLENCTISNNATLGIRANTAQVNVRISNVMIANNGGAGFDLTGGGILGSFGNNRIAGNAANVGAITPLGQQ